MLGPHGELVSVARNVGTTRVLLVLWRRAPPALVGATRGPLDPERGAVSVALAFVARIRRWAAGLLTRLAADTWERRVLGSGSLAGLAAPPAAGTLLDTHGAPVIPEVRELLKSTLALTGPVPVLLERDNDIPPFDVLLAEVAALRDTYNEALGERK